MTTVPRAQSTSAVTGNETQGYRDVVPLEDGTYGVELRGRTIDALIEARVGTNTSRTGAFHAQQIAAARRQPFSVRWSNAEVSLTTGGRTISYSESWHIGNAIRISARGRARLTIATAGGQRVDADVAGTPAAKEHADLVVAGSHVAKPWTLHGTIDWPDEPNPADAVIVTTGQRVASASYPKIKTFADGVGDLSSLVVPEAARGAVAAGTGRSWTGNNSANWNDSGNWSPMGVPASGETLTFGSGSNKTSTTNNLTISLGGVNVETGTYQIQDNGLTLLSSSVSTIERNFGVDTLAGSGTINLLNTNTTLTVGRQDTPVPATTFSGTITGSKAHLAKDGPGMFTFSGDATGITDTEVREGSFFLDAGSLSDVIVTGGTTRFWMRGGRIGNLNVRNNGTIGSAGATASTTGSLQFEGSDYIQTISGLSSFEQLIAKGTVRVSYNGNTKLTVQLVGGYVPPVGMTLIMVDNDGTDPVDGTFQGLPEGATIDLGGVKFRISYVAGTGNDIGLTVTDSSVVLQADLSIAKTVSGSFVAGDTGSFQITVSNVGTAPSAGLVTMTDMVPAGFIPETAAGTGWGCSIEGQQVVCTRTTPLAVAGSFPPITIGVRIATTATSSVNAATVRNDGDHNPANDRSEVSVVVTPRIDLTLSKTHADAFQQGGTGSYAIVVRNAGAAASTGIVTVSDVVPAGLTPTSAAGTSWSCAISSQTVTCTRADALAPGATFPTITIGVSISPSAPPLVTNTATLNGGGDVVPANNSASDPTPIASVKPDLSVTKTQGGAFKPGQIGGTFAIAVTNGGSGPTTGAVTVTDTLPAGLTPTAASGSGWTCNISGQTATCSRSNALAAGQSHPPITITVNVALGASRLSNTASVSGGGDDTPDNNTVTIPVTINSIGPVAEPDLIVAKTHTGEIAQGGSVAFEITVRNIGLAGTSGTITISDPVPSGLTPTAATGSGWSCVVAQTVTCSRSDVLAPLGTFPAIALTASVAPTAASSANTVTVSGGGDDSPENNSATDPYAVAGRSANLIVAKTHVGQLTPGQSASFTILVSNAGTVPTTGPVAVQDVVAGGLTPTSATGPGWSCAIADQHVTCGRTDSLAGGASYPAITLAVAVGIDAESGSNVVAVAGGGDTTPGDNTARDEYLVAGSPNLTIDKTHAGNFIVGQQGAAYEIVVHNSGTAPSVGEVVVDDSLPTGLTPVSAAGTGWSCTIDGQAVECRRSDSLPAAQSWPVVTLTVNVGPAPMAATNVASVSGGGDLKPNDNTAADSTTVAGRPQLTIIKKHADPVVQGTRDLPFTIVVTNNGTGPTTGAITVTDVMPAGLTPTDAAGSGWVCSVSGQTVSCTRSDSLAAAADYASLQIRADVAADAVSAVNDATVAGGGDTTPADNVAHDPVPISPAGQPNLVMTKRHDGNFFQGQPDATYGVRVANAGVSASTGAVTVADTVPPGLTPTSATGPGWNCSVTGQQVQCSRGDALAPGVAFPEIAIVVNVAPTATDVVNVATLAGGGDQTPSDNSASDPTHIVPRSPDLTITKRHVDPFVTGQTDAAYQITVQNVGTGPTDGEVAVTDRLPAGLLPISAAGSGWTCVMAARTVTCRSSDQLGAGASFPTITLTVAVQTSASNLINVASVSGGGDTTAGNNTTTDSTSINVSPDATIALARTTALVVADTAEYDAVVTNLGPGLLGGETVVVATFPTELVPMFGSGVGWSCSPVAGQRITCARLGALGPNDAFAAIRFRVLVRLGPSEITVSTAVANGADANPDNNQAVVSGTSVLPTASLGISHTAATPRVAIGGTAAYRVDVTNTGDARLLGVVVRDLLPRGFAIVDDSRRVSSSQRNAPVLPVKVENGELVWPLETLDAGETVTLAFLAAVGADARRGSQNSRATVSGLAPLNETISGGPAVATVDVTTEVFTMLQALVGRVFEDVDGNGLFGGSDHPIAHARVITSTGQAALTDSAGLYNIPSIGSGTVAVSLDRDTVPANLTLDDGPGGRSWTRLLRTPIGGGSLLTQNFPLRLTAGTTPARIAADVAAITHAPDDPDSGHIPPRREYETRQGSSLLIGLGEVSFGRAAQELELFEKDKDAWGYGSVFYQGPVGSPKNRLTLAADSRRNLNGTTERDRLFELDPNDRAYPVFGDASTRQEFATSNSKVFGRFERGASHVMYGDLIGDLPSSDTDGGRWSSYERHLTGAEFRLANAKGDHVTIRGAQPDTAYARDAFADGTVGLLALSHIRVLAGTETVALEVRDRRVPDRLLEREVFARGVDYTLEPDAGTIFLLRHVAGLDPMLNLVQLVVTYEYENDGVDHLVFNGRTSGHVAGFRLGATFFTEEGIDDRFTVAGMDLERHLPHGGHVRFDLPYSHGTPNVSASVARQPVDPGSHTDGLAAQGEVEQPFAFWRGVARGTFLYAENDFRNPFAATITPGSTYVNALADLSPRTPSRVRFGGTYEHYDLTDGDATRTTVSGEWAETIGGHVTLKAGYDGRALDRAGTTLDSGLFTGQAIVKSGDRFMARVGREQNVKDDTDPTYPDQTTLEARMKLEKDTSLVYAQRIGDAAIVPVGNFAATGFSELATKGELNIGIESLVEETTTLTSQYRIEQGINGPDAFALIGARTHFEIARGIGTSFGLEHGTLVSGQGDNYTSGTVGIDWVRSERVKATARYEGRDRGGFTGLFSAGAAARLASGVTTMARVRWADGNRLTTDNSMAAMAAVALRPANHDRLGWLLSYQYLDPTLTEPQPTVAPGRLSSSWRHLLSTDAYAQPLQWLELHGKFAWQRSELPSSFRTDTYLSQARVQVAMSRYVDAAFEERYINQPVSHSHREGTALEVGFWPLADFRIAVGYNFRDTRDSYGRDLQGRASGAYLTLSTKLSRLFDLFGSRPPAARQIVR